MNFDYYYGDESNQFAFYRIPRQLITGEAFKKLSTDAKLLYGLLLDRMGLSAKNGWYDDMGRVFIYYTLDEIQEDLNCGHEKAVRLLAELDTGKKGFGLIERVKQGQGRPTKIYSLQPPVPQKEKVTLEDLLNCLEDDDMAIPSEAQPISGEPAPPAEEKPQAGPPLPVQVQAQTADRGKQEPPPAKAARPAARKKPLHKKRLAMAR